MNTKLEAFEKKYTKEKLQDIHPGDIVQVHQKIKEGDKERIQIFEGLVLALKHGSTNAALTVRKIAQGVAVERIFFIHSPLIEKIEIVKRGKVRRAKLYYLRTAKGKKAKMKHKDFAVAIPDEAKQIAQE